MLNNQDVAPFHFFLFFLVGKEENFYFYCGVYAILLCNAFYNIIKC